MPGINGPPPIVLLSRRIDPATPEHIRALTFELIGDGEPL